MRLRFLSLRDRLRSYRRRRQCLKMLQRVQKNPEDPLLRKSYADVLLAWGFHSHAAHEYRRVRELLDTGASTVPLTEPERDALDLACEQAIGRISGAWEKRGDACFAEGDFVKAEACYVDALLAGSLNHNLVVEKLAEATIARADKFAESVRTLRSAELMYLSATRILPEGHPRRAYAEGRLGELGRLLRPVASESPTKDLEEIVRIVPRDPDLRKGLAMRYCMEDRLEEALRELDRAREADPAVDVEREYAYIAERYGCRGVEASEAGDYETAKSHLERSLAMRKDDAIALHLGEVYSRLGDSTKAKEIFGRFISQNEDKLEAAAPEDYSTRRDLHESLASMYERVGAAERALAHRQEAAACRERVREKILSSLKKTQSGGSS